MGASFLELAQEMQRVVPALHIAGSSTPFGVIINSLSIHKSHDLSYRKDLDVEAIA